MDISLVGAAIVWFHTGYKLEQVRLLGLSFKNYLRENSSVIDLEFSGSHLVLCVLCNWLCPRLGGELSTLTCLLKPVVTVLKCFK